MYKYDERCSTITPWYRDFNCSRTLRSNASLQTKMLLSLFILSLSVFTELMRTGSVKAVAKHPYERQELLEAYEAFGVDDHMVQNEFELFRHAESTYGSLKTLLEKELGGATANYGMILTRSH